MIVQHGKTFVLMSQDGKKLLGGPYKTRGEAEARERQVQYFKARNAKR